MQPILIFISLTVTSVSWNVKYVIFVITCVNAGWRNWVGITVLH